MFWDKTETEQRTISSLQETIFKLNNELQKESERNYELEEKLERMENSNIPNMIKTNYDFENFCNDCKNFDITCNIDTISSPLGGEKAYTNLTCEHINTCRRMYEKFKKEDE